MLFVAGALLAPPQTVDKVVLIYHEQEILAAEQPHIDIMQKHFGDKVSARQADYPGGCHVNNHG